MPRKAGIGRADLVSALSLGDEQERAVAEALGYQRADDPKKPKDHIEGGPASEQGFAADPTTKPSHSKLAEISFLIPDQIKVFEREPVRPTELGAGDPGWPCRPVSTPPMPPLGQALDIADKLRKLGVVPTLRSRIDIDKAVHRIASGFPLANLPLRETRRWAPVIRVVLDRRPHLTPIHEDQIWVIQILKGLATNARVALVRYDAHTGTFRDTETGEPAKADNRDEIWLALTDFGAFSGMKEDLRPWRELADHVGLDRAAALCPAPLADLSPSILRRWRVEPWQHRPRRLENTKQNADRLLTLLSPSTLIAAGMLRALRVSLGDAGGVAVEHAALMHSDLKMPGAVVSEFMEDRRKSRLKTFEAMPEEDRRKALAIIRAWRTGQQDAVQAGVRGEDRWFAELLDLSDHSRALSPRPEDVEDARAWFAVRARQAAGEGPPLSLNARAYLSRMGAITEGAWREASFAKAVYSVKSAEGFAPPLEADTNNLELLQAPVGPLTLSQSGNRLLVSKTSESSPLATIPSDDGILSIYPNPLTAIPKPLTVFRDPLQGGAKGPEMIWLPAGSFLMGSPMGEEGRYDDEGPQQQITFADPFALARYPVTFEEYDAFCDATAREQPPDNGWGRGKRPVINVSWADAGAYCDWLSAETGEPYHLPSEAEWEYACRAGSDTPFEPNVAQQFSGQNTTSEEVNYDGDYPYKGTQKGIYRKKTVPTKGDGFRPNKWGLWHMHGNVWEWCADIWSNSHDGAATDGSARQASQQADESDRVLRGGSWYLDARFCRSAFRFRGAPDDRRVTIGFRPARGQQGALASRQESAERAGSVSGAGGGKAGRAEPTAGRSSSLPGQGPGNEILGVPLARFRVTPDSDASLDLQRLPKSPFVIRTDRAELLIQRTTRSDLAWASGLGRDRFGLWAEIAIDDQRPRLRYCPPGRFIMGSPEDEPGRYNDEGPLTEVTFETGFWLFETPLTQALYQAVLPDLKNPSRFQSPSRPVEQVTWQDAQNFLKTFNDRIKGLNLHLPSEAAWEYACRAGSQDATYDGPMDILGENDAPVLDEISWYGGNSGLGYDLDEGDDSSGWPDKQYPHKKAGTRRVGLKRPNAWGLHDMIGNVWEWCEDVWQNSHEGAVANGSARQASKQAGESGRVLRGGSWFDDARDCRSAYRNGVAPDFRFGTFGFRPARGQQGAPASRQESAERSDTGGGKAGQAEPTAGRRPVLPRLWRGSTDNFSEDE